MTRIKKNKKKRYINYFKEYVRTILYSLIGTITMIYLFIKNINKITIKLYNKLPKILKVSIIYTMIILSVLYIYKPKVIEKVIYKENIQTITIETQTSNNITEKIEENKVIDLQNDNANNIYNKAIENGLTKEQAILLVSISRHETGNWTSKAFNDKNNFGGIMCNGASEIKRYTTYEEGLNDFIRIVKTYYFDMGLNEIAEIGAKYCPIGAINDPNNLNQYWVGGVTEFYNYYMQLV